MQNFTDFTEEEQKDIAEQLGYGDDIETLATNDEAFIPEQDFEEYAEQLFDDVYGYALPDNIKFYIDYGAFARDLDMDYSDVEINGTTYKTRSF